MACPFPDQSTSGDAPPEQRVIIDKGSSPMTHMKKLALLILPLSLALSGHAANARTIAQAPSCAAALDQLMATWQSIGFAEPGKPAQMIVAGSQGYTTTGGQFNFMRTQIRVAARDCAYGRDADAMQHINTVRAILEHSSRV
jgi:hypothetical protein